MQPSHRPLASPLDQVRTQYPQVHLEFQKSETGIDNIGLINWKQFKEPSVQFP